MFTDLAFGILRHSIVFQHFAHFIQRFAIALLTVTNPRHAIQIRRIVRLRRQRLGDGGANGIEYNGYTVELAAEGTINAEIENYLDPKVGASTLSYADGATNFYTDS